VVVQLTENLSGDQNKSGEDLKRTLIFSWTFCRRDQRGDGDEILTDRWGELFQIK
jgi:hypothetical protein